MAFRDTDDEVRNISRNSPSRAPLQDRPPDDHAPRYPSRKRISGGVESKPFTSLRQPPTSREADPIRLLPTTRARLRQARAAPEQAHGYPKNEPWYRKVEPRGPDNLVFPNFPWPESAKQAARRAPFGKCSRNSCATLGIPTVSTGLPRTSTAADTRPPRFIKHSPNHPMEPGGFEPPCRIIRAAASTCVFRRLISASRPETDTVP